jgi:glycosyltransferase involved in cell wall biosynthesis
MAEMIPGLVSTIIPVYNRAEMVREAVASVLAQSYRPIEILLVDDGSTDGTTPAVLDELAASQPDIIRVIHQENAGPGLARESGRQAALGEFIQYLDSDDWLFPRKFAVQVAALEANPECDIAYCKSRFTYDTGELIAEPSKATGQKHDYLFPALLLDRWWHTHTPLFRRSICDAAGPWPARRPEDWELEARMGALRAKLVFCDEVLSCQVAHFGEERVSFGDKRRYALDEAWFLPRLFECALRAGVSQDAPEMKRFARWAFFLARQLGVLGQAEMASEMMALSRRSSPGFSASRELVGLSSKTLGWKATVRLLSSLRGILTNARGRRASL